MSLFFNRFISATTLKLSVFSMGFPFGLSLFPFGLSLSKPIAPSTERKVFQEVLNIMAIGEFYSPHPNPLPRGEGALSWLPLMFNRLCRTVKTRKHALSLRERAGVRANQTNFLSSVGWARFMCPRGINALPRGQQCPPYNGLKSQAGLLCVAALLLTTGCQPAFIGMDSEADIAAENCYAYRYGDKLRKINFTQAFDWCHRSARFGNSNSQALLGELYYLGLGGEQDIPQAEQWFTSAARQGHAHAQFMLYRIYAVSEDSAQRGQADYWLKQARQSGYKLALQAQ
jgi:hypothetical protein